MNPLLQRRLSLGTLRAFDAVARRLNFRAAAEELHLTQPAVSRQIRSLEDDLGMPLFIRGTRHVELTQAGTALMQVVSPWLETLDDTVRRLRADRRRQPVALTTFASLASMWLLPRLAEFQAAHPDIDIRISATDALADLDDPELDLALRSCRAEDAPPGSVPLFDEVLTPVASPSLLARTPLRRPADLARHTLLEEQNLGLIGAVHSWRAWLARQGAAGLEPRGWLVLDFTYQQIQAAMAGQGVGGGVAPRRAGGALRPGRAHGLALELLARALARAPRTACAGGLRGLGGRAGPPHAGGAGGHARRRRLGGGHVCFRTASPVAATGSAPAPE